MSRAKNTAIFLDRDGTIIEDKGYLGDPSEVVFFPETIKSLQKLQRHFLLFIVTNQTGVAQGKISLEDVKLVNRAIINRLARAGVEITETYVCPHERSDNCRCIKPKPYFLKKAERSYGIDLTRSFTVGDHPHDIQLGMNAGANGIYVLTGHGRKHLSELPEDIEVAAGIMQAAEKIISFCRAESPKQRYKKREEGFILNLGFACDLWSRADLGSRPEHASEVAKVLRDVGIKVYTISGGWLECEPRPVAIWEALTGKAAPADLSKRFNCPTEKTGCVLQVLAEKGIPVSDISRKNFQEKKSIKYKKKGITQWNSSAKTEN